MKKVVFIFCISIFMVSAQSNKSSLVKSLILPGWGQINESEFSSAKQFLAQDGLLWISLLGTIWTSNYYEQSYITFAQENAGINLTNADLQMAVDVGNYSNLSEFNESIERRREFGLVLDENDIQNHWDWNSDGNRNKFEQMRINSGISKKVGSFVIAGLIGHRIISAIHVKYLQNKKIPKIGFQTSLNGETNIKLIWNF